MAANSSDSAVSTVLVTTVKPKPTSKLPKIVRSTTASTVVVVTQKSSKKSTTSGSVLLKRSRVNLKIGTTHRPVSSTKRSKIALKFARRLGTSTPKAETRPIHLESSVLTTPRSSTVPPYRDQGHVSYGQSRAFVRVFQTPSFRNNQSIPFPRTYTPVSSPALALMGEQSVDTTTQASVTASTFLPSTLQTSTEVFASALPSSSATTYEASSVVTSTEMPSTTTFPSVVDKATSTTPPVTLPSPSPLSAGLPPTVLRKQIRFPINQPRIFPRRSSTRVWVDSTTSTSTVVTSTSSSTSFEPPTSFMPSSVRPTVQTEILSVSPVPPGPKSEVSSYSSIM